jgi:riboflavin biosynthesis pyrimidine reductase
VRPMRRIFPDAADAVDPAAEYTDARRRRRDGRPWILVNMITSFDGAVAIDERSGGLGGPADRRVFAILRGLADLVLVGAGTARAERYGPPARAGQRIAVVTRSADLDWSSPLFASGAGLVITTEDAPAVPVDSVRAGHGSVDLIAALGQLSADVVLCEGGPSLNGDLVTDGAVDEWCMTLSPVLVGGSAGRAARSRVAHPLGFEVVHVLEEDGFLFVRAVRR